MEVGVRIPEVGIVEVGIVVAVEVGMPEAETVEVGIPEVEIVGAGIAAAEIVSC